MKRRDGELGPGGVGDGLPALPTGEPVLHRWFVIAMLILVPIGIGVTVWAFMSVRTTDLPAAARHPPGSATVTHDRGDAALSQVDESEPGPDCAEGITLVGDEGQRATARRALAAVCQLIQREDRLAVAGEGLSTWIGQAGVLRIAVFELTGVDDSARLDEGRVVIELNAKFQFEDATRAAPAVIHELVHLAHGMPGRVVTAQAELAAVEASAVACSELVLDDDPPRVCSDARELLEAEDPLAELVAAGFLST